MTTDETQNENPVELCPNCIEPIPFGATICPHCGEELAIVDGETVAASSVPAEPAEVTVETTNEAIGESGAGCPTGGCPLSGGQQPEKKNVMSNLVRGMGVYLIYFAITRTPEVLKFENPKEKWLGLTSNIVYLIAGILAVWPWVTEYLEKRKRVDEALKAEEEAEKEAATDLAPEITDEDGIIDAVVVTGSETESATEIAEDDLERIRAEAAKTIDVE